MTSQTTACFYCAGKNSTPKGGKKKKKISESPISFWTSFYLRLTQFTIQINMRRRRLIYICRMFTARLQTGLFGPACESNKTTSTLYVWQGRMQTPLLYADSVSMLWSEGGENNQKKKTWLLFCLQCNSKTLDKSTPPPLLRISLFNTADFWLTLCERRAGRRSDEDKAPAVCKQADSRLHNFSLLSPYRPSFHLRPVEVQKSPVIRHTQCQRGGLADGRRNGGNGGGSPDLFSFAAPKCSATSPG